MINVTVIDDSQKALNAALGKLRESLTKNGVFAQLFQKMHHKSAADKKKLAVKKQKHRRRKRNAARVGQVDNRN